MTQEDKDKAKKTKKPSSKARTSARQGSSGKAGGATKSSVDKARTGRRKQQVAVEPIEGAPQVAAEAPTRPLPRLHEKFRKEVGPALTKEFGYASPMQIPRLSKIVLNIGMGEALQNPNGMEAATRDLTIISGQKPVITRAKKSIAGFKLRDGMAIGLTVTLRGRRMYEFFDRLVSSALPRVRDFQGVSRQSFDGRGNFSLGIREQIIFPEIDYNSIDRLRGLQAIVVTTARGDSEGLRLLELMGMPFVRLSAETQVA